VLVQMSWYHKVTCLGPFEIGFYRSTHRCGLWQQMVRCSPYMWDTSKKNNRQE
jgi:hypothetical protein